METAVEIILGGIIGFSLGTVYWLWAFHRELKGGGDVSDGL